MCIAVQYSNEVKYADPCVNTTLVQATHINKEVSSQIQIQIYL